MDIPVSFRLIVMLSFILTYVMPQPLFGNKFCYDSGHYAVNGLYQMNLDLVLSNLTAHSIVSGFYSSTAGDVPDKVFAFYNCRGDMTSKECNGCIKAAAGRVVEVCPGQKEAIIWYHECMLHYANQMIFGILDVEPLALQYSLANYSDPLRLGLMLNATMEGLIMQAAHNSTRGYATGRGILTSSYSLYGLVQCTPDLLGKPCEVCLRIGLDEMLSRSGIGSVTVIIFLPSCQLRYSLRPFYARDTAPPITSLPPPAPEPIPPRISPNSRPTIYQIPSPIPDETGRAFLTSQSNFYCHIVMALILVALPGNIW